MTDRLAVEVVTTTPGSGADFTTKSAQRMTAMTPVTGTGSPPVAFASMRRPGWLRSGCSGRRARARR